nr:NAD-dependent epimerase/dehydratase family protein [Acidobacteriota bacterium]
MKVIVTGSTGLVGRALVRSLLSDGHEVTRLVRGGAQEFRAPGTK